MSEEVHSNFVVFGGGALQNRTSEMVFRCVGILVSYETMNLFICSPMYEVGDGDELSMESGLGLSVFPKVGDALQVCRSLLGSGRVNVSAPAIPIEEILGIGGLFDHLDANLNQTLVARLSAFDLRILTTGGIIGVTRNPQGSLTVSVETGIG